MSINPISSPSPSTSSSSGSKAVNQNLTQEDFLKLLTVQLQNQDPMEPMKDTEFVSQMANFTALQQTTDISNTLSAMSSMLEQTGSVAYLGKQVTLTDAKGKEISGLVTKVGVEREIVYVNINGQKYDAANITSVTNPKNSTNTPPVTTTEVATNKEQSTTAQTAIDL